MKVLRNAPIRIGCLWVWWVAAVWFAPRCFGQGTLQITFDGPPIQPPQTQYTVQQYYEAGMRFWSPTGDGFSRRGPGLAYTPQNGTAYLAGALPFSLSLSRLDDLLFGVVSAELAGYSTGVPIVTGYFVGHRMDGSTVNTSFTPNGLTFQTFYFGPEFNNLTRMEVLDFGAMDNLVVSIPEPGIWTLLLLGGGVLWLRLVARKCR